MSHPFVCQHCSTSNRSNARFCARCGAGLSGAPPAPQHLQTGAFVHNRAYRILRPLSKGGMGMIYLAEDLGAFDRLCVIKEMLDYFDPANPQEVQEARQRFEDEARTLAKLKHPQIPNLLSYFSERQHNYIVMAYVEGVTLDHFIGQQQATIQVVEYGIQTCEILEYLGGLKPPVVHHDIKPANIIVDNATKSAWLVDFGVAKARLAKQQNGQVGVKKSSIFGTTGYAPPEQYQSQSEPRSDVYALAATLYHVLTGDDPQDHPFSFPQLATLSTGLADALSAAVKQDVRRRCTAAELRLALVESALRTPAPRKTSAPLFAASQHESYAVIVTQPIADRDRPGMVRFLQQEQSLSALEAEVLTWQSPARYVRGIDKAQAAAIGPKLKARGAVGFSYVTSQVHSWRQRLSPSEQSSLAQMGEVFINDKRLPQDRECRCHQCGHEWKTQARDQSTVPETCPSCRRQWYRHRIFRCALCGHEFTNHDVATPAERLYSCCPKCKSVAWLPRQQTCFTQRDYTVKLPPTPLGRRMAQQVQLEVSPRGTSIRGRVATTANWLLSPMLQSNTLSFVADTNALAARRNHTASLEVVSNAGVALVTVEVYVEAPPSLAVAPSALDFGVLQAKDTLTLKLELHNTGEQVLAGQVACSEKWLTLDKPVFTANQHTVHCTVSADRLLGPGIHTTTLSITTNGGALSIPARAEGLPPTLTVKPQLLDYQLTRRRGVAPQPLIIENAGLGLLTGSLHSDAPWLLIRDAAIHAGYLETLIGVDAAALEPGQRAVSTVNIVTNGGAYEVPVTVQVAARGILARLAASDWLAKMILLGIIIALIWVAIVWWPQLQPAVTPPPTGASSDTLSPTSSPTPRGSVSVQRPVVVQPSSPLTPTPETTPTPVPPATFTPAPGMATLLPVLDRLRTQVAQRATQTADALPGETRVLLVAPQAVTPRSAQCSDPRALITAPLPGQTLRGNVPVYGTAEHAAFRYYKLEIAPRQADVRRFSFVVDNDVPVTTGFLAMIDTTRFADGEYILQLTVVDRTGNFPAPCQVPVYIEN